jgi:hypothetical protein
MKVCLEERTRTRQFCTVESGECFVFSDHVYLKLEKLVPLCTDHRPPGGSTGRLGGYNAVRLDIGRMGSFQPDTCVRPENLVIYRDDEECL